MSSLYHEFLVEDREFTDYDDFKKNCRLKTIKDFNFAYDIVDRYASDFPGKRALVWLDDNGEDTPLLLMIFPGNQRERPTG